MGYLEFPFAQHTQPHCGLVAVNCDAKPLPKIQLETGGDWYQLVRNGLGPNTILLEDSKLHRILESGGQCTTDSKNAFDCKREKIHAFKRTTGNNSNLKAILIAFSGALALILLSLAIFVVWRRKKGSKGYSRNTSSDPTSDLERCQSRLFGILVFSYSELEDATSNFDPSKELGDGGFGTVYYGILGDGREVAVKRLHEHSCKRMEQFANEISILTKLKHRNLVMLYGCSSRHNRELLLVYEYIPNGTLADHLHGKRAKDRLLTWLIRMKIAVETAAALVYLHASGIIHRDVKTSNILLDKNFCVKVADFGLSRLFPADVTHATTTPQGTPGYVDPDYHECYQLTYKSDVYSFGVVLIELISSMPAVDIRRHTHEINLAKLATNKILTGAFDELIDPSLGYEMDSEIKRMTTSVAELAFQCLQPEKDTRPTMEHVLESLKEIQGNELNNGDKRVNGEETNVSKEEDLQQKAVRWTWAGPSLAARGTLKHVAALKSSC